MIRLRIEGLMLERLLERAVGQGARFARVERDGPHAMAFETGARGARILRALCQRHSLRIETVRLTGAHALLAWLKRRWTLLAGLALCVAALFWYTQRIWIIEVSFVGGGETVLDAGAIARLLREAGLRPGVKAQSVDTDAIELALYARTEELSFVGARRQGVRLLVEVAEALPAPQVYEIDNARDLVAACDGVIVSVNAQSGVAAVKPGDTVRRGDVLIRGEERSGADSTRGVAALGSVVARTWFEAYADAPTTRVERVYTGRTSVHSQLRLMDKTWTLAQGERFAQCEETTHALPIVGLFVPLSIERTTRAQYVERASSADEDALKAQLSQRAFALIDAKIAQTGANPLEIIDKWIDYSMIEDGRLYAHAVVELHREIATTREALAQEE